MNHFYDFFIQNWLLFAIFFGLMVSLVRLEISAGQRGVSPQQATLLMNRENAVIVDLRDENNFKVSHIPGAKNIKPEFPEKNNPWSKFKKKKLILVSDDGRVALKVSEQVKKTVGHEDVLVLEGGLAAWKNENLPLRG